MSRRATAGMYKRQVPKAAAPMVATRTGVVALCWMKGIPLSLKAWMTISCVHRDSMNQPVWKATMNPIWPAGLRPVKDPPMMAGQTQKYKRAKVMTSNKEEAGPKQNMNLGSFLVVQARGVFT